MTSKQWLTIEDWLESNIPLCPLTIRHEGRLERVETESKVLQVCFANAKIGGGVLDGDVTQETVHVTNYNYSFFCSYFLLSFLEFFSIFQFQIYFLIY